MDFMHLQSISVTYLFQLVCFHVWHELTLLACLCPCLCLDAILVDTREKNTLNKHVWIQPED